MYYWTLMHKSDKQLAKQVFNAQRYFPSKSDWKWKVRQELDDYEINLSDDRIFTLSKDQFKKIVNTKIREFGQDYLRKLQMSHKKTRRLSISDNIQPYLLTDKLTPEEKITLFKLGCEMTDMRKNFCEMYKKSPFGLQCELCGISNSLESQSHPYECSFYINHPEIGH